MKITIPLPTEKEIYKAGREAGLTGSTLDGFAMLVSKLKVEVDFDNENIELKEKVVK